jgi:hypothetical protein
MSKHFRTCAVCGKRHGPTYGFKTTLARLGIKGDKAVPECVTKAQKAAAIKAIKEGHPQPKHFPPRLIDNGEYW